MKIAIVEKETKVINHLLDYFSRFRPKVSAQLLLYAFLSPKAFFDSLNEGNRYDIVLIDVETGGLEVGKALRKEYLDELAVLIFMGDRRSDIPGMIDLNFFGFLQKPIFYSEFQEKISRACVFVSQMQRDAEEKVERNLFSYKINRDIYQVDHREIVYLKSDLREIFLHLWSFEQEKIIDIPHYYGKLDAEEKKLPADIFFRVHKSYLVNSKFIRKVSKTKSVTLIEGTEIPMSGAHQKLISSQICSLIGARSEK